MRKKTIINAGFTILMVLFIQGFPLADTLTDKKLTVYYFHRTLRCPSCILLENITHDAVLFGFKQKVDQGKIELKIINIDDPLHAHFIKDYDLSFQSVVLVKDEDSDHKTFKRLDNAWDYISEADRFAHYIQAEIQKFYQ